MNLEEILQHQKTPKVWPWVVLGGVVLFVGFATLMFFYARSLGPGELLRSEFVRSRVQQQIAGDDEELFDLLLYFLGFSGERTYLVLIQDNMAIRPGGGLIDAYALVRVDRGTITIEQVEGSDALDARMPADWHPQPPRILADRSGVDRWGFRDSNWSPDFAESAKQALDFYRAEGGVASDEVEIVLGVTPTVFERWLELLGPLNIGSFTVNNIDVANTLAYDARIGYKERGLPDNERMAILEKFLNALVEESRTSVIGEYRNFIDLVLNLSQEKQLLAYATNKEVQSRLDARGWAGTLAPVEDRDYLLWVDANVGAGRTDRVVERNLHYSIASQPGGRHIGVAVMHYNHTGAVDWQTDVYDNFARAYVPKGSDLLSVIVSGKNPELRSMDLVERGTMGDKEWFGTHILVPPGEEKTLQFIYLLPASLSGQVALGEYGLTVQKQPGALVYPLTADLEFGRSIRTAAPGEPQEFWGDATYQYSGELQTDARVQVTF